MQADAPLVRETLVLAGHLIEAHLSAQLVGPELILAVVVPVLIEGVAPQSGHRGPLGVALLLPPGIRPLHWVGRSLSWRMSICVGIVALPEVTLSQQMYGCRCRRGLQLRALIGTRDVGVIPAHPHLVKARGTARSTAWRTVRCPARGLAWWEA